MLKRIWNLWELSKKGSIKIDTSQLNEVQLKDLREGKSVSIPISDELGDGKAVFLGEGTEAEFLEQERKDKGEDAWYERILRKE